MNQPLAYIDQAAHVDPTVIIEPFVTIARNVTIGAGTRIGPGATILENTFIGKNCVIFPGAVVGGVPQDLKYAGEETYLYVGDNTVIRECVTIHRGTASKGKTVVGRNCLIMAYCHVAHDCILGDNIIMSNSTQLAGEVVVGDYAVIGGGTLVHQFTHIGQHTMIQGGSRINKDIPPYVTAGRDPICYAGVNSIGMRRRGFTNEQINVVQSIYRLVFQSNYNVSDAVAKVETEMPASAERDEILLFICNSSRGILKGSIK